jgi:hypothetical protein
VSAGVGKDLKLNLPVSAVKDLVSGAKESIKLTLTAKNANGTGRATASISPLRK